MNISLDFTSKFSQFTKWLGNWKFLSSLALIFCQIVWLVFQAGFIYVMGRGANIHYVLILRQFKCWKHFPSLNEGKNCKLFLELHCCHHPNPPAVFGMNPTCLLSLCFAWILPIMQKHFPNH